MNAQGRGTFGHRIWSLQLAKHLLTVGLCVWALYIQTVYRVPGRFLFVLLPWVSLAVLGLSLVIVINYVLNGAPADDPARRLSRWMERVSGVLVRLFVYYSILLFANGALDAAGPEERESEVLEIVGEEIDLGVTVPYSWANLPSWERPGGIERLLLFPGEHRRLWAGQAVLVQIRPGYFGVPWVHALLPDEGKYYTAVLKMSPAAKLARQALIKFSIQHGRWPETAAALREYLKMYPDDYQFAQQMGKALGAIGRYHDMLLVLEPFVTRRPSYEVYNLVGFALGRVGRKAEAIQLLRASIPLDPDNWWAYYFLGYVYSSVGNYAEAIAAFEKVLAIRPHFPEVETEVGTLRTLLAARTSKQRAK